MKFVDNDKKKKICIIATVPFVLKWFMTPHITLLSTVYDVTLVTNGTSEDLHDLLGRNVKFIPLRIERKVSIRKDIIALIKLWLLFRENKFDSIHSIMPKSGLLSMLAGKLASVPLRFHTFTGQVWVTSKGFKRFALRLLDKLLVKNATRVLADSYSQRLFLIENNVVDASEIEVLAEGSVAGVNTNRFKLDTKIRHQIRQEKKIPSDAIVFLFLGRLTHDKGIKNLSKAFIKAAESNSRLHLLVVGPDEDELEKEFTVLNSKLSGKIHRVGFTERPEDYMSAADVFCLPSYREGFGSVIIEAAAVGIPTIASNIYGITDAVVNGVTGILHEPKSLSEISNAMLQLASDKELRDGMGAAAKERATTKFSEYILAKALHQFYRENFISSELNS